MSIGKRRKTTNKPVTECRFGIDPCLIDATLPVPDSMFVCHQTLHQLRTLPWNDAARLLSQIILAAEHAGTITPSTNEKRMVRALERLPDTPPHHDNEPAARQYRRDLRTLRLSRPAGRPTGSKTGQKR